MKKKIAPLLLALLLTGCGSLIPKPVELFQSKVQDFPEAKAREVEVQREAASMAASKAQETLVAAVSNNCPVAVVAPAQDTADLTRAVSTVVGPPKAPYTGDASVLAAKADATVAKLDSRVADFKERNDDLAGKKIEDTGLFKIPYAVWLGGAVLLVVFVFILFQVGLLALKVYGTANPAVGLGVSAVSAAAHAAASLFSRGFEQVVKGGENFKTEVTQNFAPDVAQKILSLFQTEQIKAQDNDVKTTVQNLTQK